jgi:hypothetical protein
MALPKDAARFASLKASDTVWREDHANIIEGHLLKELQCFKELNSHHVNELNFITLTS